MLMNNKSHWKRNLNKNKENNLNGYLKSMKKLFNSKKFYPNNSKDLRELNNR